MDPELPAQFGGAILQVPYLLFSCAGPLLGSVIYFQLRFDSENLPPDNLQLRLPLSTLGCLTDYFRAKDKCGNEQGSR